MYLYCKKKRFAQVRFYSFDASRNKIHSTYFCFDPFFLSLAGCQGIRNSDAIAEGNFQTFKIDNWAMIYNIDIIFHSHLQRLRLCHRYLTRNVANSSCHHSFRDFGLLFYFCLLFFFLSGTFIPRY